MKRDSNPTTEHFMVQERREGEADEKGLQPHHRTLHGAGEEGWEGTGGHMKTAPLNWPPSPVPHTKTSIPKTGGKVKSSRNWDFSLLEGAKDLCWLMLEMPRCKAAK